VNQVALITGASTGLGLSLAKRLVESGALVFGVSRTRLHWKRAKEKVANPKRFFLYQADVSKEKAVRRLITRVFGKTGRLDIVVNNAGYAKVLSRVEDLTLSEFRKSVWGNLISSFLVCKHVTPYLKKQGRGLIINVSSMAGKRAVPRMAAYSAAKFGVVALSQCLAKENPNGALKCITVCPGGIRTRMRSRLFGEKDAVDQQSPDRVARIIHDIIQGKIEVESGGDVLVRNGRVTAVNPLPPA